MKIKSTILSILAILAVFFAYPSIAKAGNLASGSLIKYQTSQTVYYLASDGYKYAFPDEATFLSWNADFSKIITPPYKEIAGIRSAKTHITARPGAKLVKFSNSPRVYVIEPGAVLRWLKDEEVARMYYGANWGKQIITLSLDQLKNYVFGEEINWQTKFSKTRLVAAGGVVDDELRNRGVIKPTKTSLANYSASGITLRSIRENLRDNLSPQFNPLVYEYEMDAEYNEEVLKLKLFAQEKTTKIYVNGEEINNDYSIQLSYGKQEITIVTRAEAGGTKKYTLIVNRRRFPSIDATDLVSLTENLIDDIIPTFDPNMTRYFLRAGVDEEQVRITAKAKNKDAYIYINGQRTSTQTVYLGEYRNDVSIVVRIYGGFEKEYIISIYRNDF